MALDLWSSSFDQFASGGFYSEHSEWKCDFYFGYGRDVIEEDALNEESCVRVLRILLTKADTEIEELEKDLLSLQNELAWVEHEKWPEKCSSALSERINLLDVAVSDLKNDHADGTGMQLLLHGKPAKTLHEIVKALQRDHCEDTHGQRLDANILNPLAIVTEQAPDEDSSTVDSNVIIKEEGKELSGTSENSRSSELILELHEKQSDIPEKIEVLAAKCRMRSPDREAISSAPDHYDEMKLSEASDNEVPGNEEIKRSQLVLVSTDTGQILNLISFKDDGNIQCEAKNENANVNVKEKDDSSDDSRLAIGIKGRKKYLHSELGTSQHQNPGNADLDNKLCDFAPKTARRSCKKETKIASDEDLASMELPLQTVYPKTLCLADTEYSFKGSNGNNSERVMNIDNATLSHAENAALISLLGAQSKSALYRELQLTDEDKQLALDYKSEIAASLSKSSMGFPSKLEARGKLKPKLDALEALESCTEVIPKKSNTESTKRQRKSKTCTGGAILNDSLNRKNTKRAVQPVLHEAESGAIVVYDSKLSELKKRRFSNSPITVEIQNLSVNMDRENSDRVSMDNRGQVDHINKYALVGSCGETSAFLPGNLNKMTLTDLRVMAKQHNVKKYYKLKKEALVEKLVECLSCC